MEPESSLLHSQVPATCPYPEPDQLRLCPSIPFPKIHLNIILQSMPGSSQWSLSLTFPHQNPVYMSSLPHIHYMPRPSYSSLFDHPNVIWLAVQISVCVCVCARARARVCMCVRVCVHMCVCMYVCMYMCVCVCVCVYIYIYIYIYIYTYIHTYTHTHTHIHTHTHVIGS